MSKQELAAMPRYNCICFEHMVESEDGDYVTIIEQEGK
jgi:hypothetical protein